MELYNNNESDDEALKEFMAQKKKSSAMASTNFNHQSSRNIFTNSGNPQYPPPPSVSSSSYTSKISLKDDDKELREYIALQKGGGPPFTPTLNTQSSRNMLSGVNLKRPSSVDVLSSLYSNQETTAAQISSSTRQVLDEHQQAFAEFMSKKKATYDGASLNTASSRNILDGVDNGSPKFRLIRDNSTTENTSKPKGMLIREGSSVLVSKDLLSQKQAPPPLVTANSTVMGKRGALQRENSMFVSSEKTTVTETPTKRGVLQRENSVMVSSNPRGSLQRENSIMTSSSNLPRGPLQRENSVMVKPYESSTSPSGSSAPRGPLLRENSVVTKSAELPRGNVQKESSQREGASSVPPKRRPSLSKDRAQLDKGFSRNDQGYKQSINQRFLSKMKQRLDDSGITDYYSDSVSEISIRTTTDSTLLSDREICDEVGFTHQAEFGQLNHLVNQFMTCGFPVLVFDKLGSIEYLNHEAEDLFGVYSFSAMGEHMSELFLDDASVELHQAMYEFLGPTENSSLKADSIGSHQQYLDDIKPYNQISEEEQATRRKSLSEARYLRAKATMLKQFFVVRARIIPIKKLQEIHFCVYLRFHRDIDNEKHLAVTNTFKHAITDLSIIPVITITDKGIIQIFNKAASATFGYEAKELIGRNVKIICNKRDRLKHDSYIERCKSKGNTADMARKVKGETKSGKIISLEIKISQISNAGKTSYVAYLRDYKSLSTPEEHMTRIAEKIFPKSIAERLSMGQTVIDTIDCCTMLYCDMVGFTDLSHHKSPKEVVKVLHEIFTLFDNVTTELNLEKIKTIGDCYFMASGLSKHETKHADNVVKGGLSIIRAMKQYTAHHNNDHLLSVRLGIHTGNDVIAAVVGKVKRTYDLFGPAVGIAQLMEATGKVNQVHISNTTYKELRSEKTKALFSENLMEGEEIILDKYSNPMKIPLNTWVTQNI